VARRLSSIVTGVVAGVWAIAVVSCGSRTGLFGPEPPDGLTTGDAATPPGDQEAPDAPSDAPVPCIPGRFPFVPATAQLMFVIDRSGSMAASLDGTDPPPAGEQSRWQILRTGLAQTIVPFDHQIAMGAKFFPEELTFVEARDSIKACRTEANIGLSPKLGNAQIILNTFDNSEPIGGTPTAQALRIAGKHLVATRGVARTMVLATDGAPNCNHNFNGPTCVCTSLVGACDGRPDLCLDDANTIGAVKDIWEKDKVPVYVIGLGSQPDSVFRDVLDQMAVAGGRPRSTIPRYYGAQTSGELSTALQTIRDGVAKCTYLTPSAPTNPDAIVVEINGVVVARDPSHTNGWDWVDQTYGTLAFFGSACEQAQTDGARLAGNVSCKER
jgi:hypothetical protein